MICGAGIAGLTLAGRLHNILGWEVVVLEKAPGPRSEGYMIDFFGPGYDAAEVMGVLPWLEELSYPVSEVSDIDENGRRRAGLKYDRFARAVGGRLLSIMRPDLELALRERRSLAVGLRFATGPVAIDARPDGVRVTLTDGSTIDADLLVGADGIHSTIRALTFGEERQHLRRLGFHTAAFVVDDPEVRAELGDRVCLTDTVGRQIGLYGLRDGKVAVFAVHRTDDADLPTNARTALRQEYGGLGWMVPRILARCLPSEHVYYAQVAQVEMARWSRGRVALVGDACHAVSLLAGQGASPGVAGAYLMADQLARATSVEQALRQYERLWRPVVENRQRVARGAARWFVPDAPLRLRARRRALDLAGLPGAGRLIGAHLAGKRLPPLRKLATVTP
ncbi:FAD-dependent monooxygenase [Streptomyces mirabilis]|uniref:FAD-dependent monooxygenase n=1 Tax=Streptomyces mirabilis TaxID=68239 RepID=UPI003715FAC8